MNAQAPLPSRRLKAFAALARIALWLLAGFWLALVLAWGALHGFIVPRIGELRPDLEIEATRVLGVPVRIGAVSARSEGLVPSFELRDVQLLDGQGRTALRLARVVAALSPRSLWNLGFEQLYIEAPELDIRRAADGRLFVAGLDFSREGGSDERAADWFFSQKEFIVRGGLLRWTDELRDAPPLALSQVDLVMRNGTRRHAMRLDATPPAEWGDRFTVRGLFRQPLLTRHAGRWRDWQGQVHADFARVDVSRLRRHAQLGFEVSEGRGAVRAWADVDRGQLVGGTADVVLADVNTRLAPDLEPLAMQAVSGRLGGRRLAGGFEFQTQDLQFTTAQGQRWPGGNLFVSWTDAQGKRPAQGELRADRLDLGALGQIASRLPLGTATHAALSAYAPRGLVETIQARWQGAPGALEKYEARGRASGLEVAARPAPSAPSEKPHAGSPGVRGASVDFELTQSGGRAKLVVQEGALEFPGVFDDPVLPLQALSGEAQWQLDGAALSVKVNELRFANVDLEGSAQASWRTPDRVKSPAGTLDLQATLTRADGARVFRYLPLGVGAHAREYVRDAVKQGAATAKFKVKGDLHDFPFPENKRGEFLVTAQVSGVTYAYVPHADPKSGLQWPALTQLAGELVFSGNGMQVKNAAGRIAGTGGLTFKADARIPDFHTTTVAVTGQIRGPLADSLAVVRTSPLSPLLNQALDKASASGAADVQLALSLPVARIENSRIAGTVSLANNDVQITPDSPQLARARGAVTFSERGFALAGVQARALGGDVRLEGGSRSLPAGSPEASVVLRAQGTATAEGLRQARELGFVSRLAQDATGGAPYSLTLAFRRGHPEVALASSLQGLALNLPAPLNKPADTALPLKYETALVRESLAPGARLNDQLTLEVGRLASVVYVRDVADPEPRVLRGGLAVGLAPGETVVIPEQGVQANINLGALDLDSWQAVLERAAGGTASAQAVPAPREAGPGAAQAYLPNVIALRAQQLTAEGRTVRNVVVGGSRDGLNWRANVDADELNGYVEYRQSAGPGAGRVYARLARLNIAASAAQDVEQLLEEQPAAIPALDIVVDDFELKGRRLGRLEIDAVNRGSVFRESSVREWRLNRLALTMPEATFSATGNWAAIGAQGPRPVPRTAEPRRTVMNFRLEIQDSGQLLARFGMKDVVRRGRGRMEGQVAWTGSPLSLDYPTMNGAFNVNVEGGQFLKADPGLAKLLGVLSLQSLPRRLTLDFRDVFSEGFAFDFVRGDIAIQNGIASTNNLQMKGVNAAVLMEGKADIARETQDLKVVVVPEINAGTASLVATVINPAIGLGTFLAQMFLRQPLMRAATQEFHVDGTWADPRMTRVARTPAPNTGTSGAPAESEIR